MSPTVQPCPSIANLSATGRREPPSVIDAATETSIVLLVAQRARLGHVAEADRDDLAQYLRKALIQATPRYRPADGAWSTFVRAVLLGEVQHWLRHQLRACRNEHRVQSIHAASGAGLTDWAAAIDDPRAADAIGQEDRRTDIQAALSRLSVADQQVAALLMHHRPTEVLRLLGWSKARLYRAIARVRAALLAGGVAA